MHRHPLVPRPTWLLAAPLVLTLLGMGLAPDALAQEPNRIDTVYTAVNPGEVGMVLREMGIAFEQSTDSAGDPKFSFEFAGYKVMLLSYGCEAGRCQSLQLYAGFSMGTPPELQVINEWNKTKRFGRAYLDADGDPVIESDLDLEGGVSPEAIAEWIRTFGLLLSQYTSHIGFN